jgi:cobyrinic acid a,c-diamide synthase
MLAAVPRVVLAAPYGRSGKTTVAVGLGAALAARGLVVQPFKKGPDYIDPSWLSAAAGRPCRTLDAFLMGRETLTAAFARGTVGGPAPADVAVVEGAMGLYDGLDLEGSGSTATVARWLQAPVLLVVNAQRMTRSVAAVVQGYQHFEADSGIAGVILNNVARERHRDMLVGSIERYCKIPVVGVLPHASCLAIPDRHLGLVPLGENEANVRAIAAARQAVEDGFDLAAVLAIARSAPPLDLPELSAAPPGERVIVGVLRDRAFSFYYPENLEALEQAGAHLVFVDTLHDISVPAMDALYAGGGFPEVFASELESNRPLRAELLRRIENGLPVYAECGGLMYLSQSLSAAGTSAAMVGALPCTVRMMPRPQGHGYVEAVVEGENPFFALGTVLRGHEFHNSHTMVSADAGCAYRVTRGQGLGQGRDGLVHRNVLASYTHLHALATPEWAPALVAAAIRHSGRSGDRA